MHCSSGRERGRSLIRRHKEPPTRQGRIADVVIVVIFVFFLEALCSKLSSSRVVFVVLGLVRGVLLVAVVGLSLPARYRRGAWLFTYPEDAPRSDV